MRASIPHSPILKELFRRGNLECYMQRQRLGISDSDSNSDISPGVARYQDRRAIQVGLRTSLFYPFRDSRFLCSRQRQHLLRRAPLTAQRSSMPPTTIQSRRPINRPPPRSVCTSSSKETWRRCLQAIHAILVCQTESTCFGTAERSRQWLQGETTSHTVYIFPAGRCSSIANTLLLCSQRHFRKSCRVARAYLCNRIGRSWYSRPSAPGPSHSSFRPVRNSYQAYLRERGRRASAAGEGGRWLHLH